MLSKDLELKLVADLFLAVPEFQVYEEKNAPDLWDGMAYILFDRLGSFVSELMLKNTSSDITDRCFDHINKFSDLNDPDIEELLGVTFLESLASIVALRSKTELKLRDKALVIYLKVVNGPMFNRDVTIN